MSVLLAIAVLMTADPAGPRVESPPPPPVLVRPPIVIPADRYAALPDGRYEVVGASATSIHFDLPDRKTRRDDRIDAWRYTAWIPARGLGDGRTISQVLSHEIFDCRSRTVELITSLGFNEAGAVVVRAEPEPPKIHPGGTAQAEYLNYYCGDGGRLAASGRFILGWREALALAQKEMADR